MTIPDEEFNDIRKELRENPLTFLVTGITFGLVTKRSSTPDYSRFCSQRPKLYKLLLTLGEKYVDSFTSCTLYEGEVKTKKSRSQENVKVFTFDTITLVYYTLKNIPQDIPKPRVEEQQGKYIFYRGAEAIEVKEKVSKIKNKRKDYTFNRTFGSIWVRFD